MDWTKAKNIIILALVATNLFLIFTYAGKSVFGTAKTNDEALMRILAERGISVETQIPKKNVSLPIVQCEYADVNNEDVKALMRSQEALNKDCKDEEYVAKAEEFLSYLGIMSDNVSKGELCEAEKEAEGEKEVVFRNEINGIPLDGNYIKCIFRNGKIEEFQCIWLTPVDSSGRKLETISASVALMSLTNSDENSNIEINKIEMVYWVPDMGIDVDKAVSDTAFPTWKITASDGKEFYVEAVQL